MSYNKAFILGEQHDVFLDIIHENQVLVGEGEGPKAEFYISGDYEVFAKISRAELGSQKALMNGMLKLKGNMVKALKLASLCDRLNKIVATIETEF